MTHEGDLTAPGNVRGQVVAVVRERRSTIVSDLAAICAAELSVELPPPLRHRVAEHVVDLFASVIDAGEADPLATAIADFDRFGRGLMSTTQLFRAVYHGERVLIDELALHERLGAPTEPWPVVEHVIRRAAFDTLAALAERLAGLPAGEIVRDPLTTLIARPVFHLAIAQEVHRAQRHGLPLSLILLDIDNLAAINATYGFGVGDRVLERLGILARRFFRTHDWVARHEEDSIAALLPETSLDHAMDLAERLRSTVEQRLAFKDEAGTTRVQMTISAAAVGSDVIDSDLDPHYMVDEAEAALRRVKLSGGNRVEPVALLPTSVSLIGAANLLKCPPSLIRRLVRTGQLAAARKGRHYHVERASVERYRVDRLARQRTSPN